MKRTYICIGCDSYYHLGALRGAERDARRLSDHFLGSLGNYQSEASRLLLSPTYPEVLQAFQELFSPDEEADVLTCYFAGHGVNGPTGYFLCLRDTDPRTLSTSSLSFSQLLSSALELRPAQINIIVDACQASGGVLDLAAFLRRELLATNRGSSLAVLFACASDEYAKESVDGGIATNALLDVLEGRQIVNESARYLDLVDIGRVVADVVEHESQSQHVSRSGLNLTGESRFVTNPHFRGALSPSSAAVLGVPPSSAAGLAIASHADSLWDLHFESRHEIRPRAVVDTLTRVTADVRNSPSHLASFLLGFDASLSGSASRNDSVFSEFDARASVLVALLPHLDLPGARELCLELLTRLSETCTTAVRRIPGILEPGPIALFHQNEGLSVSYLAPLRFHDLLSWTGLVQTLNLLGASFSVDTKPIWSALEKFGPEHAVALSDGQAVGVLLLAFGAGPNSLQARKYFRGYVDSFVSVRGQLARRDGEASDLLRYLWLRGEQSGPLPVELYQRPSQFLTAILAGSYLLGDVQYLDESLPALDRLVAGYFVPDSYSDFHRVQIESGMNVLLHLGEQFWSVDEFMQLLSRHLVSGNTSSQQGDPLLMMLVALSSYLFDDRLPLPLVIPRTPVVAAAYANTPTISGGSEQT